MCATGSGRIFYCARQNNGCKQTHIHTHRPFVKRALPKALCSGRGPPSLSAPWDGSLITIPRAELLLLFSCRRSLLQAKRHDSVRFEPRLCPQVSWCLPFITRRRPPEDGLRPPGRSPSCDVQMISQPRWDSDTLAQCHHNQNSIGANF